ncbi:MAG: hypothetical protein WBC35_10685 [Saprospiraceae bacterium]
MKSAGVVCLLVLSLILGFSSCGYHPHGCFPGDKLPAHIIPLTDFGQRAEWSIDCKKTYFLDKAGGEVWVVDIRSKKTKQITKLADRPAGHGYYRVLCLSNGDLLLGCGAKREELYFQVLDKSFKKSPATIEGESLCEGPAVSRKSMKIAWTLAGQKQIFIGELAYTDGQVKIINKKLLIDNADGRVMVDGQEYETIIETQNWRPALEEELIYSEYRMGGDTLFKSEVFGIDIHTGKTVNYTQSAHTYDEPEGIFPNGVYTLTECDRHRPTLKSSTIEVYKLKLDGTAEDYERLTFFSDVEGFRASNPVVHDDGNSFVFQASEANSAAGAGCGLYLFDIKKFEQAKQTLNNK